MSRHSILSHSHSNDRNSVVLENAEILAVIREEQITPPTPSTLGVEKKPADSCEPDNDYYDPADCPCANDLIERRDALYMVKEKEEELKAEFTSRLEKELNSVKERFDFILQNEQVRASFMLREAHRERQEKVQALQRQLECKNMAGLMYVMCSERRKCKLEKLKLVEEYTNYIHVLQDILAEGQKLILHLSRGYKTAARVDQEWREKTASIITEFQAYVYHYGGGSPDTNQYVFDIPALLKTQAAIEEDPDEDPCPCPQEEQEEPEVEEPKEWYENMEGDKRPFILMGDMGMFLPDERAKVMKVVRATKSAPPKWKDYVFNNMFLKADCPNVNATRDEYLNKLPEDKWTCHGAHSMKEESSLPEGPEDNNFGSRESYSRRPTLSYDMRTAMGSLLKMITASTGANVTAPGKAIHLLGARDSMEIASSTKLRDKFRESLVNRVSKSVSISFGASNKEDGDNQGTERQCLKKGEDSFAPSSQPYATKDEDDYEDQTGVGFGSLQQDSLHGMKAHVPDKDHKINSEKYCPMPNCQRQRVGEFMSTLPAYWNESPFAHFQETFDSYETCTPEQLEILRSRIEATRGDSQHSFQSPPDGHGELLDEWTPPRVQGVSTQTSEVYLPDLPPCICRMPYPSPGTSVSKYNVRELLHVKEALDEINKECFFDNRIEFNRFKVIGQPSFSNLDLVEVQRKDSEFKEVRATEITKILNQHPSLLELFQGNTV